MTWERRARGGLLPVLVVLVTVLCAWLTASKLRVSADLSRLFPKEAAPLARYARVFGGGDRGIVLLRGRDVADVEAAAADVARVLKGKPSVIDVVERVPTPHGIDPTLAWAYAGPAARARLAEALTPEGMRRRLQETRAMLLAPGASGAEEWLARDPLRLAAIPWEGRTELAAGVTANADGAFVADEGRARLVLVQPKGNAFDSPAAGAFVNDAEAAFAEVHAAHPDVTLELTGGHAISHATEGMLRHDLALSGILSTVLASITFLLTFRRARALVAVLPPLVLGTVWTTGAAALWPQGLSAIAIAFAAVVVGVGVDTGVHVYAALLDGRRRGLSPANAARFARQKTWRPTLTAAVVAGLAFGSLALSDLAAAAQLGVLCGVGEVLTAVAILLVTPEIGAWLERSAPPPARPPAWVERIAWLTATRERAYGALAVSLVAMGLVFAVGWPRTGEAFVALRPRGLTPLVTQETLYRLFGGRPGQWLVFAVDPDETHARERADALAEAMEPLAEEGTLDGFDALTRFAPAPSTKRARLAVRDALDLPARGADLARALEETGFDVEACRPALDVLAHPSHDLPPQDLSGGGPFAWVAARYLGHDDGGTLVVTYVRPSGDAARDAKVLAAITSNDPRAVVTGYERIETALRGALARDLPRIGLVALAMVIVAMRAALRRFSDVLLALVALGVELGAVGLLMRVLAIRWHVYDALVVPVLVGITIDESMFLLHAARAGGDGDAGGRAVDDALRAQGPLVASTALTTAAGFGALLACRFEGLFDLGAVGALGSLCGLAAALVVVPAGLRLRASSR